jgi:hypothetical protein
MKIVEVSEMCDFEDEIPVYDMTGHWEENFL